MSKRFNIHDWQDKQKSLNENDEWQKRQDALTPGKNPEKYFGGLQDFDDRLKAAGGFSDEEFDDITSRDIGNLHGNKASDLIDKLRGDYRGMSDDELDDFSVEMINHFLDNTAAAAAAKVYFAKKQI